MNIDELKQVGEILATLSGDAFDGYLLWIAHMFFETTAITVLWGVFWVGLFKIAKKVVEPFTEHISEERVANELRRIKSAKMEEFETLAECIKQKTGIIVFPHGDPASVTRAVDYLIKQNRELAEKLEGIK